jgi:type IV fimbrial biogenesis protein FimT
MMRQRGFTLIELMVALAVAAVLLTVAVPSFFESTARSRLEGVVNELAIDLQYARSEAVRERAPVVVLVVSNGASYTITNPTATLKTVTLPAGVTLTSGATVSYDALRGISQATTFTATASGLTPTIRVSTNALGRVQVCAPTGKFGSAPAC